jgi:adenylate kinase
VLHFVVDEERLVRRMSGRRTCVVGGEIYHLEERPPKVPGRCDNDGGELIQRADDREEAIRERLAAYNRQTRPLVEYYRGQGVLVEVDGTPGAEAVSRRVLEIVRGRRR